ncbi:alpha/beta hydrolase [Aliiruegeria sabulilitoris]|uniref:alpha/beta hydrolase n=1 Tax=Aliiruegeria sabulilitoris TaxID=1510458 RepID=UPI0008303160|nr:alpha/beta hydrolase [Aliiruegeria sabulilitoris]NDR57909.1 alpha/beta hydrolase [Pseudoruegeria sp. M32A2M]
MKKCAYLTSILLVASLVSPNFGAAETLDAPEESAEVTDNESVNTNSHDLEGALEQLSALAPPPRLSDREPGLHTISCLPGTVRSPIEVEGATYTCGVLTVPQNWGSPDGRNLDLGFLVARATGETPQPDPLIFLAGGPGASGVLAGDFDKYERVRTERDIIFFDIRGVGVSQRLGFEECLVLALENNAPADQINALQAAAVRFLAIANGEAAPSTPGLSDLDLPLLNATCWEQFISRGIDPNQFTTASSARDTVELIKALGRDAFNIEGASYGTRLAMTIMDNMAEYENAPELRSVILDSTFPPSVYLIRSLVRSDHDFMLQLLDECQADAVCDGAYPNLAARLAALLNRLEKTSLRANGETVTIDDVVDQLTDVTNTRAGFIPRMIAELELGELDTYLALRAGEIGTAPAEPLPAAALDPSDPVQAFIADASALLDDNAAAEFRVYVNIGLVQEEPLLTLQAIIAEGFPGETGDQMLEMLQKLTRPDIAASPYVAQQIAIMASAEGTPEMQMANMRLSIAGGLPHFLFSSIHCADDILHERFEDAVNSYNDLQLPQLADLDMSRTQAGRCEKWPISAAPIEVKDPVSSSVPTIILQGAYDFPTPVYMGRRADRELESSILVLIPQQGHGTWNHAESCVGRIATGFVQNPDAEIELGCVDAREPQWALPLEGQP